MVPKKRFDAASSVSLPECLTMLAFEGISFPCWLSSGTLQMNAGPEQ